MKEDVPLPFGLPAAAPKYAPAGVAASGREWLLSKPGHHIPANRERRVSTRLRPSAIRLVNGSGRSRANASSRPKTVIFATALASEHVTREEGIEYRSPIPTRDVCRAAT